ncbi:MAG TPA: CrcB family protein [Streptosporangiaceae bacterium]|jgi:CrcB protein|nr:CrcB family protein [Streptosporangiaceae bacterium]
MYKAGSRPTSRSLETTAASRVKARHELRHLSWQTLTMIALGGVIGSLARQGLLAVLPHRYGAFDLTTLGINVGGCALIGALMVAVTEVRPAHRLAAPFLGAGVLGGFTTFSTYIIDIQRSIISGAPATGLAYLAATLAAALLAAYAGVTLTRSLSRLRYVDREARREEPDAR